MKKPTLVILAAEMGSRYGGLKQIDPISEEGDTIIDFSIFDAIEAGFSKVVFVIRKDFKKAFKRKSSGSLPMPRTERYYRVNEQQNVHHKTPQGTL